MEPERVRPHPTAGPPEVVTSELRWFADGPVPAELSSWFLGDGLGAIEERCDRYRLDGFVDVGVKLRGGEVLELKRRESRREGGPSVGGPRGVIELWHKWSPADGLVESTSGRRWVEVHKRILRRRFSPTGAEILLSDEPRSMAGVGCDVEIVAVEVDGTLASSFALAAFGPRPTHLSSLASAWRTLAGVSARAEVLVPGRAVSCGYPEWIEGRFGHAARPGSDR